MRIDLRSRTTLSTNPRTVHQLDFERRWLCTKLSLGSEYLTERLSQEIIGRIELLDFEIAASPAKSAESLLIKLNRLGELMFPFKDDNIEETMEGVYFNSIVIGAKELSE